jgi:hypothetical protein
MCRMAATAPTEGNTVFPPQSQFVDFSDLTDNGWTSAPYTSQLLQSHNSIPDLQMALNFLSLAAHPGDTTPRNDQHDMAYLNSENQNTLVYFLNSSPFIEKHNFL